jgi:L-serine dehydratase
MTVSIWRRAVQTPMLQIRSAHRAAEGLPMAAISIFDILKIGVGPSSSHTLGPWRAAQRAVRHWQDLGLFDSVAAVRVDLYGSLAKTGRGHMTDVAVMLGLSNDDPETCRTAALPAKIESIRRSRTILLGGRRPISFDPATDCRFNSGTSLPFHPNGLTITAVMTDGRSRAKTYYSVGGG